MGRKTDLQLDMLPTLNEVWESQCDGRVFDLTPQQTKFREECHQRIKKALPNEMAENYITEVEHNAGYEFWSQFETVGHAVHDARIYWDALTEPPVEQLWYEREWNL